MRLMGRKVYNVTDDLKAIVRRENVDAVLVSPLRLNEFRNNQEIQNVLIGAGCKIYMAQQAKEASVKDGQLSDEDFKGMQIDEVSVEDLLPRSEIKVDLKSVGELLKDRRVLITGAADYIFGRVDNLSTDDGILTAREISRLDLSGLDLVVLSACETGLGDISGEGVYGLQRGFKKAGAQTLLVSLWKVDDEATQLLMTEFYRGLLDGKTKRQAFIDAQRYLRSAQGGRFNRYECWAAFVMIDALS